MSDKTAGPGSGPSQGSPRARFRTSLIPVSAGHGTPIGAVSIGDVPYVDECCA